MVKSPSPSQNTDYLSSLASTSSLAQALQAGGVADSSMSRESASPFSSSGATSHMTRNATPTSRVEQRQHLRLIIDAALALIDEEINEIDATEKCLLCSVLYPQAEQ
jgi:hypothetical protein